MIRSPWGREYARRPDEYVWGREPSAFALRVKGFLRPGARVLDLGCGEGRDSVFFASLGCDVTGVDVSAAGLEKAERLALERGAHVCWVLGDAGRCALGAAFDLVYSCGAVHYVARPRRARLFARLKAATKPGGVHAHVVFTDRLIYVEKGERLDYFARGELGRHYADWRGVWREETTIMCAQDGTRHRHSVEELVARAPGGGED
jgi:tellurite methyltransferase